MGQKGESSRIARKVACCRSVRPTPSPRLQVWSWCHWQGPCDANMAKIYVSFVLEPPDSDIKLWRSHYISLLLKIGNDWENWLCRRFFSLPKVGTALFPKDRKRWVLIGACRSGPGARDRSLTRSLRRLTRVHVGSGAVSPYKLHV